MSFPQPVPPSWKDLGKSSNDLLSKDYHYTGTSLEVKTRTPSDVTFRAAGNQDAKGNIAGELEAKYTNRKNGLVFTQAWTTTNALRNTVELENQIVNGLKIDLNTTLLPEKGSKNAIINAVYKASGFHTRTALDVFKGPTVTSDVVVGRDGFLFGAEAAYNVTNGNISRYAAAVGYNAPEYSATLHALNNLNTFSASYYHRVNPDVEAGAKAVYDTKATHGGVGLEVGTKAYLDQAAFVKAKINNVGVIALGYTQALRPGIKASIGMALDTQKLGETNGQAVGGPVHKVGMNFVFES